MNDFSESGAAVRFVTAWCVHVEGKRNFDGRGVEIVTCAAVGAEIHACFAGVVMTSRDGDSTLRTDGGDGDG